MGNAIGKIVEELLEAFKRNYKKPKLWIVLITLFVLFVLLIPYIDSNFFYFSRMEKRIAILEHVMTLDQELIESNPKYMNEYQSILAEIEQQNERSINSIWNKSIGAISNFITNGKNEGNRIIKFFTGAMWALIIMIWVPFMNTFNKKSDKVLGFFLMLLIALLLGWLFSIVPTVINPLVNYIGVPVIQLVVVICIFVKSDNKKRDK